MKLTILLLLFGLQLTAQTNISLTNFDNDKVETLLFEMINDERAKKRCERLKNDKYLIKAADLQSEYQKKKKTMTHTQKSSKFKSPKKRVEASGGKFSIVGENVAFTDVNMTVALKIKGKTRFFETSTYEEIAKIIFVGWVNSKHHYENMIDKDYQLTGLSVRLDTRNNRLYATQVFGKK